MKHVKEKTIQETIFLHGTHKHVHGVHKQEGSKFKGSGECVGGG